MATPPRLVYQCTLEANTKVCNSKHASSSENSSLKKLPGSPWSPATPKDLGLFTSKGDNPTHSLPCGNHSLIDKLVKAVTGRVSQVNLQVSIVSQSTCKSPKPSPSQAGLVLLLNNTMEMLHMKTR